MAVGERNEESSKAELGSADPSRFVFLSYASSDAAAAQAICRFLETHGGSCWMAPRDVRPGAQYADAIIRAINEAAAFIVVLSAAAVASSHVTREIERAGSKQKPLIAFRTDAAPLSPALEYFLSDSQWIDVAALGMPAALEKLLEAVQEHAEDQHGMDGSTYRARRGGRSRHRNPCGNGSPLLAASGASSFGGGFAPAGEQLALTLRERVPGSRGVSTETQVVKGLETDALQGISEED
jgi:hypothetical protein